MVRRCVVAALTILALGSRGAIAADESKPAVCATGIGESIVLRSSDFDPDVLVWDSRQRATDYATGLVRTASDVLTHTLLSKAGTRAVVVACLAGSVRPRYVPDPLDAIGVRITSGPQRGRYGWVTSDDVLGHGS